MRLLKKDVKKLNLLKETIANLVPLASESLERVKGGSSSCPPESGHPNCYIHHTNGS